MCVHTTVSSYVQEETACQCTSINTNNLIAGMPRYNLAFIALIVVTRGNLFNEGSSVQLFVFFLRAALFIGH